MNAETALLFPPASGESGEIVQAANAAQRPPNAILMLHRVLKGRYPLTLTLVLVGSVVGAFIGYLIPKPQYRSVGVIRVQYILPKILYQTEQNGIMPMFESYLASQVAQVQSRRVINEAMVQPEWKSLGRGLLPAAVANFQQSLSVNNPKSSPLIQVSFSDNDPAAAAIAVKAVIEAYVRLYADNEAESGTPAITLLENRRVELMNRLNSINDRIQSIANDFGSTALQEVYSFKLSELNRVESQLRAMEIQRLVMGGKQAAPTTAPSQSDNLNAMAEAAAQNDPWLNELYRQKRETVRQLEQLASHYGNSYSKVVDLRALGDSIDRDISERLIQIQAAIASGLGLPGKATWGTPTGTAPALVTPAQASAESIEQLHQLYDALKAETVALGRKNVEIDKLRSDAAEVRERLAETKTRIEQLSVEKNVSGRITVMSYGDVPLAPDQDRRKAMAGLGGFGLGTCGLSIVIAMGLLDRRMRHIDTARTQLKRVERLLGVLPELPEKLEDPEQAASAAHCLHHVRAMLQIRQRATGHKAYAITSPSPGDGKTSLTISLGMSLASSGCRTLVIDADADGAALSSRLNVEGNSTKSQPGLREVLAGESLNAAVRPTGYPLLSLLPLKVPGHPHAERLSPESLRRVLDRSCQDFDTVLVDCGPILGSVEAAIVSAGVDGVILLVSRGGDRTAAAGAVELLHNAGAQIEGIVFNRAESRDVAASGYASSATIRASRASVSRTPGDGLRTSSTSVDHVCVGV